MDPGEGSRVELVGSTLAAPTALMLEPHLVEEVLIAAVLLALLLRPGSIRSVFQTYTSEKAQEQDMRKTDSVRKACTLSWRQRMRMAILGDD